MNRLKVTTVVGTRPEIIRLSRVMAALDASPAIEHITVHTGQNYDFELNQVFYDDLGIRKPDHFLNAAGKTATATIGQILIQFDALLEELRPDAVLILGDTNSCLCAIPAKKRHIPIFHMEAGNRCFDQRVPEETNRKIVDHIADINLTYSSIAREYLLREGLSPDRVIKTGSPMHEVLHHYRPQIEASGIVGRLQLEKGKYFVVSAHREENISSDRNFLGLLESLNRIAVRYNFPIIVSTHPRTRKRLEELQKGHGIPEVAEAVHRITTQLIGITQQQRLELLQRVNQKIQQVESIRRPAYEIAQAEMAEVFAGIEGEFGPGCSQRMQETVRRRAPAAIARIRQRINDLVSGVVNELADRCTTALTTFGESAATRIEAAITHVSNSLQERDAKVLEGRVRVLSSAARRLPAPDSSSVSGGV